MTDGVSQGDAALDFHQMRPKQFAREAVKLLDRAGIYINRTINIERARRQPFHNFTRVGHDRQLATGFRLEFSSKLSLF
ncbi:hypothetical protein [Sphingomonas sp. BK580]|uniref:hypothetical protein n=1 Tax=Sphingomonas sp. BK580 TaxID=2586972 RepID=UPI00161F9704|nr:hypothetical protein [Sphingomonas sp. BK580]MBB3695377.1 hypothetical protein [Sphingomonas sp. BK580]